MDVGPSVGGGEGRRFDSSLVTKALRSLITSIQHRNNSLNIYNSAVLPRDSQPDIRWVKSDFKESFTVTILYVTHLAEKDKILSKYIWPGFFVQMDINYFESSEYMD